VEPHGWLAGVVRDVAGGRPAPRPTVLEAICGDLPVDPPPVPLRIHVTRFPPGDPTLVSVVLEPLPETEHEDRADVLIDRFLLIASHVRHEINNPLMGVLGYAELLEDRSDLPDEVHRRIRTMREEADKIRDLVRELGAIRRDPA
jgi:signal transduction histidine kinase